MKVKIPKGTPPWKEDDDDGTVDDTKAREWAWDQFQRRNVSLVSRYFMGQMRNILKCTICGKVSLN